MPDVKSIIPSTLYAGAAWLWDEDIPDYSASDDYVLTYVLINATAKITITTTNVLGTYHRVNEDTSTTGAYTAGTYNYQRYVTKDSEVTMLGTGTIVLTAFYASNDSLDARSYKEKTLDLLKAAYQTIAAKAHTQITMPDGRSVTYDRAQLIKEIHNLETELRVEQGVRKGKILFRITK